MIEKREMKQIRGLFKLVLLIGCLWFGTIVSTTAQEIEGLTQYVNPFIGATTSTASSYHGLGKTFPGATTPFGMTQVSPNTVTGGDNGSGYSNEHRSIEGFAFTQMSGVGWYGDLGNLLTMPTTGELKLVAGKEGEKSSTGYRSVYDKNTEEAKAGYYAVELQRYHIKAEATATPHGGALRFTFPEHDQSRIQIDLARRVGGTSTVQYIEVVDKYHIRGWMKCDSSGGGWGNGEGKSDYTVYFYAEFSKPITQYGFWSADIPENQTRKIEDVVLEDYLDTIVQSRIIRRRNRYQGKHIGFFLEFPTKEKEEITMKVGIAFTDLAGAKKNFQQELADQDFDMLSQQARHLWEEALSKVQVEGGTTDQKTIFYTALYHTMIDPRMISDVDGRYPGPNGQIHRSSSFQKRTVFSGWDVFRSQFPLQTIINPTVVSDMINSLISLAEQSKKGYLERWEFFNAYSGCMVGNPAHSIITDAYMKGIEGFDTEKAYQLMRATSEKFGNGNLGYTSVEKGYSISETLEYAYSDWCVAQMAKALDYSTDYEVFKERSIAYRNVFDLSKGWFRPKHADGTWQDWPAQGRLEEWYGCIESNPYQQGWFVPHDVMGMVELMGGKEKVQADLEMFFNNTPTDFLWNDYYNHANEPVHHVPFLFNRLGTPWLTQKWTRDICHHAYKNSVEGLTGNEDAGQMSAWYVLAASGIHPICPGAPDYELTSPVFDKVTFQLENGRAFSILAENNAVDHIYIQEAYLNDQPYHLSYITHQMLTKGGELKFIMGKKPQI